MGVLLSTGILSPPAAEAQMSLPPTTNYFSRMIWLQGGVRNVWRGMNRGDLGLRAGGAQSWGDPSAGSARFMLSAEASTAIADRSEVSDLLSGGSALKYSMTDDGDAAWIAVEAFAYPSAKAYRATVELAAGLEVMIPILPESDRMLLLEARRDLSRYRTTYLRSALRFDYRLTVRNSAMVELGAAWSDLPAGIEVGSTAFGLHSADLTLMLLRESDPATTRGGATRSLEPFIRLLWRRSDPDPIIFDAGLRIRYVPASTFPMRTLD